MISLELFNQRLSCYYRISMTSQYTLTNNVDIISVPIFYIFSFYSLSWRSKNINKIFNICNYDINTTISDCSAEDGSIKLCYL